MILSKSSTVSLDCLFDRSRAHFTPDNQTRPTGLCDHREGAMSADVVECLEVVLFVSKIDD